MHAALSGLLIVLTGAFVFWAFTDARWLVAAIAVAVPAGFGVIGARIGALFLPRQPVVAVWLLEAMYLFRVAIAGCLVAASFLVSLHAAGWLGFDPADAAQKPVADAVEKAATALVAAIIALVFDKEGGAHQAAFVRKCFERGFRRLLDAGKPPFGVVGGRAERGRRLIFSTTFSTEIDGWGYAARHRRAAALAKLV